MKIENAFEVPLPPAQTWRVLMDIERIAPCLPGAELMEKIDAQSYRGKVAVRLGPVAVSFVGIARFEEIDEAAHRAKVKASGTEAKGRGGAQANVEFALTSAPGGATRVNIVTDLTLNGAVAQYGRGAGMIADVSQQLINRFAETLKVQIQGSEAEKVEALAEAKKGVSGFSLFFGALWRAIRRLFSAAPTGTTP